MPTHAQMHSQHAHGSRNSTTPPRRTVSPASSESSNSSSSSTSSYYSARTNHDGHIVIDMEHPIPGPPSPVGHGIYNHPNDQFCIVKDGEEFHWSDRDKNWHRAMQRSFAFDAFPLIVQGVGKLVPQAPGPQIYAAGVIASGVNGFYTAAQEVAHAVRGERVNVSRGLGGLAIGVGAAAYGAGNLPTMPAVVGNNLQGAGATMQGLGVGLKAMGEVPPPERPQRSGAPVDQRPGYLTAPRFNSRTAQSAQLAHARGHASEPRRDVYGRSAPVPDAVRHQRSNAPGPTMTNSSGYHR